MTPSSYQIGAPAAPTAEQLATASRYLEETRDALKETVSGLSAAQWNFKPGDGCWSIAEILEHLALIEGRVHGILRKIGDAPAPPENWDELRMDEIIVTQIPRRQTRVAAPPIVCPAGRYSGEEALQLFLAARARTVELLPGSVLRGHVMPHPVFGFWDGYQWILGAAAHSARHTNQIREIQAEAKFPQG